jgi:hypothetical protein
MTITVGNHIIDSPVDMLIAALDERAGYWAR